MASYQPETTLDAILVDALRKRGLGDLILKKEQHECIKSIINAKDVLAVLPTGFGKSLIFQLLPDVFDWYYGASNSIV